MKKKIGDWKIIKTVSGYKAIHKDGFSELSAKTYEYLLNKLEPYTKNPTKRKSVKRKKAKRKTVKRKPRVTVVRKNPRRVSFRETKSKSFSSYMLRGKFMGIESPYYLGEDDRFHRGVTGVKKFKSETIARDYVLRMRGTLGRRFPTLNTVQVTRAK